MSKTILITGASGGFGADSAKTLAKAGHRVFASMRDLNATAAATLVAEFQSVGIETLELDVTRETSIDAAVNALLAETGGELDVLINNAGVFFAGISETFSPDQLKNMFEVNVFGVQRVIRAALPHMRKRHSGLIINIGSILGRLTIPFVGLYGASKHALEALTDSYRYELSQLGIDVVLVQPGPFATNLYAAPQQPADPERASGYADVAALPAKIGEVLGGFFHSGNAPEPHEVAKELAKLVETPAGNRPARVTVGAAFGADTANTALEPIQAALVHGFGFDQLAALK
ncbi:SDR family oxidoreductase [Acidipila sp. EB88]|uniref:SDR family oxidoreductase n=1 Tax=Acidipila sp. EB88 TaxID=2305226 RepID=UPI000F5FFE26|nr:SDR family oxidoreductase [Acidipila sp. EB88]RRA49270.1 SDR family oxidoreductase [Acidipila sp. EB88]